MGIAIVLRQTLHVNLFRDFLVGSIQRRFGDSALLCSGFFQEQFKASSYKATDELNFSQEVATSKLQLTTVGIHNNAWKPSYVNFKNNMLIKGANIQAYYKSGSKWHAKVFILSLQNKPIFGIIGSSNITRSAFGTIQNFNFECDVMLWDKSNVSLSKWMEESISKVESPFDIIQAPYDKSKNGNITISDRLEKIKNEILNSGLVQL